MNSHSKDKGPAHREPWFWAVFAPLIVVIVFSFGFIYVAFVGADDRVSDDYYKQGRMINNLFEAEKRALALQQEGQAIFNFAADEVAFELQGQQTPAQLSLQISHPAQSHRDVELTLKRVGEQSYRGELPVDLEGRWYVVVSAGAEASRWRLKSEADFDRSATVDFVPHL